MPRRSRPPCVVCHNQTSKYTCASCRVDYCSVACYKTHKETCAPGTSGTTGASPTMNAPLAEAPPEPASNSAHLPDEPEPEPESLQDPPTLRPLTSLKWPYVPDTSAYPDPLTRDDPKPLQLHQYEAIASSSAVRALLGNPRLCEVLGSIDALRGTEREEALQRALGVDSRVLKNTDAGTAVDKETQALRAFAEAVEGAVRGGREDVLGLDWD